MYIYNFLGNQFLNYALPQLTVLVADLRPTRTRSDTVHEQNRG